MKKLFNSFYSWLISDNNLDHSDKNSLQIIQKNSEKNSEKNSLAEDSLIAKKSINFGIKALTLFFIIFLAWALFLPIKSASIADGVVVLDFNRKTIQHLEGGIIDQILVKEGQQVKENQVLFYLHDIKAKTEQQILKERLWTMQLQKLRLTAEKENKPAMNLTEFFSQIENLSDSDSDKINEIAANQLRLFKARKDKRSGEIKSLEKKLESAEIRLKIFQKELSLIKPLVDEDNLPILREFDLQKSIAEIDEQAVTAKLQIANYQNEDLSIILDEIKETDIEIISLFNQLSASEDILKRSSIKSPVSGQVMNIKYHTVGAVIPPGGEVMNIVPQNEELIIEAKVKPQDIDNVAVKMKSKIQLTAYKGKKVPKLNGEVINISGDILIDEQTRESYFLARISINKKDIEKLKDKIELYPGMPAQVFIITGSRSLISYLFSPISDSAYKAFREE
jgi:HlyD family type I secretion membrane fusion protein